MWEKSPMEVNENELNNDAVDFNEISRQLNFEEDQYALNVAKKKKKDEDDDFDDDEDDFYEEEEEEDENPFDVEPSEDDIVEDEFPDDEDDLFEEDDEDSFR
jgi:hypothetical protein